MSMFLCVIGYGVLAMLGVFDSAAEKAESEVQKCTTAREMHLLAKAERYCGNAIGYLREEPNAPAYVTARVYTEAAAVAMVQKRIDESAEHCKLAVAAWRGAKADWYRTQRDESIAACEKVIAAVAAGKAKGR